jgi:sterol desaturase/sphingolipid hydroxylase (fatty acid hydroxylase superfamily)
MRFFETEQSKFAYFFDLFFYGASPLVLMAFLYVYSPINDRKTYFFLVILGWSLWTLIEYLLHRFVLHGIEPFKNWHLQHHLKPKSRIGLATALSLGLIIFFIFTPSYYAMNAWNAWSLTCGFSVGYGLYTHIHHASHHYKYLLRWLPTRQRDHAKHHKSHLKPNAIGCHYGVTTQFWDRIFRTN